MYHHAVDVVLELHPGSGAASAPATNILRARLVSPVARKRKLPGATWELRRNMGLYVWHLLTGPGLPIENFERAFVAAGHDGASGASYAHRACVGQAKLVSALQSALGVRSWKFSGVPAERWSAREFVRRRDAEAAAQRERVVTFLRNAPSASLRGLKLHAYQLDGVAFVLAFAAG